MPLMHSSCNDGMIQLRLLSCYAVYEFVNISQSSEFGGHSRGRMNSGISLLFLQKRHFSMTSQLRCHYVVLCKYRWDFLQFFSHPECQDDHAKNCEKLSKSVKVTATILSVPFLFGHDVYIWIFCCILLYLLVSWAWWDVPLPLSFNSVVWVISSVISSSEWPVMYSVGC